MSLLSQLAALPVWTRSMIWLGLLTLILSIFEPIIISVVSLFIKVVQYLLRLLYICISWLILAPLQKRMGEKVSFISDCFTEISRETDEFAERIARKIKTSKKRHKRIFALIYMLFILLIALPDLIGTGEEAKIRFFREQYIGAESVVLGEPVEFLDVTVSVPEQTEIVLTVTNIKSDSTLNLREYPTSKAKVVDEIKLESKLIYDGSTILSEGGKWIRVRRENGIVGWIKKQYVSGMPK